MLPTNTKLDDGQDCHENGVDLLEGDLGDKIEAKLDSLCDSQCREAKKKTIENVEKAQKASDEFFKKEEEKLDKTAEHLEKATEVIAEFGSFVEGLGEELGNKPPDRDAVQAELISQIDNSDVDDDTKTRMKSSIKDSFGGSGADFDVDYDAITNGVNNELEHISKKKSQVANKKGTVRNKKDSLKLQFGKVKDGLKGMSASDGIAKAANAVGAVVGAVSKFSSGDAMNIVSGVLDIVSAIADFLPPPASLIANAISSIFNMFVGGGAPSTEDIIKDEFKKQKDFILEEFARQKEFIKDLVQQEIMGGFLRQAQGILDDLQIRFSFINSFQVMHNVAFGHFGGYFSNQIFCSK